MSTSNASIKEIIRSALKLELGCQFYNLSNQDYWDLVSQVSTLLNVNASQASELLDPFIDAGNININDQWSAGISYTSMRYKVDASTAAKLLSTGLPYLPVDNSMTATQWTDAISTVSSSIGVDAAEAARLLSINMEETLKNQNSSISLEQWNSSISSVSAQYNVNASDAAKLLSNSLTLTMKQYPVKCLRVKPYQM